MRGPMRQPTKAECRAEIALLRSAVLQLTAEVFRPTFRDRLRLTAEVVFGGVAQPFRELARAGRWLRRCWRWFA